MDFDGGQHLTCEVRHTKQRVTCMRAYVAIGMLVIFGGVSFGQDTLPTNYPFLYQIDFKCRVNFDSSSGAYFYSYSLANKPQNPGNVWYFDIDISRSPASICFDTVGLRFAGTALTESWFRRDYPPRASQLVPVSFPSLPRGWTVAYSRTGVVSLDGNSTLSPGEKIGGIVAMSKALPGMRKLLVAPEFNVYQFFPPDGDTTQSLSSTQEDSILSIVNYHGFTVGPWAPDSIFRPLYFIDTICYFVRQCRSQNWIKTQSIADKYTDLFYRIKSDLSDSRVNSAMATIGAVLQHVNVDSLETISPEAYALIRYNTEFLLQSLRSGEKQ